MDQLFKPGPEMEQLNFLVGKWHSEGKVKATSSNPELRINGTDIYEWVLGGFFLLHRVDVLMGNEKVEVIEIIGGYDTDNKTYPMRSFDNHGDFNIMHASLEKKGVMKITGKRIRSTLLVSKDGNEMTANWERSDDGSNWMHWMDMKFSK